MINKKEEAAVILPKDVITGNAKAPVTIMEFGDYESDACAKAHTVVKEVLAIYGSQVNFIFRHFPLLKIHQKAHKAAEAAIAAAQEGKFWEMHVILFLNRRNLGTISLKSYAKEIGITNKDFLNDLINGKYGWNVQDDLTEGIQLGVTDVPAFFINKQRLEGSVTVESFKKNIDAALKDKKPKSKV